MLILCALIFTACPRNPEDALMLHLYHSLHEEIQRAALGTDVAPEYMAALISLESSPPGNRDSERFEQHVYEKILALKHEGTAWGGLNRKQVRRISDNELRKLATSYGLVQIMGYHCLQLGCEIDELTGPYQLQWAAAYMQFHYGRQAKRSDWEDCFRIHNTGRPDGRTGRRDYVERGIVRMEYYREWMQREGRMF